MYTLDKLRMMNNNVLIKVDKNEVSEFDTTKSGLVIPNSSKHKGREAFATIIKFGTHMYNQYGDRIELSTMFHEGDRILYYFAAGTKIEIEDQEYLIVRAEDIDCIVEGGD